MRTNFSAKTCLQRLLKGLLPSVAAALFASSFTGCTSLTQPINGVPAKRLPKQFFPEPKADLVPVDVSILSVEPPRDYQLSGGDILGVYVEGVLPFVPPDQPPGPPPVNFPDADSTLPPSIGFPIPVQDDGTLSLPLLEPLDVEGLTLDQVRDAIRDAYIDEGILVSEKARPIVTIIRERTYNVIVVREDTSGGSNTGYIKSSDQSTTGGLVKLPAYQNDILHALVETGGLPGLNARNEVKVLRASTADKRKRADFLREFWQQQEAARLDPCVCPPSLPDDPAVLKVPLRVKPGVVPELSAEDVTLQDGDIVYIESRDAEVFYTGGLLASGEHMLPRDYDLDALQAMAMAGGSIGGNGRGAQGGGGGGGGGRAGGMNGFGIDTAVPPGLLYILRKTPCNGQVAIEVDLAQAINDPKARPLIQPGDTLILQYKCEEEVMNFGIATFFTFGIAELFNGR